jgi:DGQHR domain-containing protein
LKFFFADSVDTVDPNFDFIAEKFSPNRFRQMKDEYPHETLKESPYDGMLVSMSTVGSSGTGGRYTEGQRFRLIREGIREFLRFPCKGYSGDPVDYPIMGDCGSYSKSSDFTKYDLEEIIEFYETCKFTHGISKDQVFIEKNECWDDLNEIPPDILAKAEYTSNTAKEYLLQCKKEKVSFEPIGVVQAWSLRSYVKYARKLVSFGYKYIAIGGLVCQPTINIYRFVAEVISKIPTNIKIHILGFNRLNWLEKFQGLGIYSFDSTSPLLRALKDDRDNYFCEDGRSFSAIRIPLPHENRVKKRIQSGNLDVERVNGFSRKCFSGMRAYSKGKETLNNLLDTLSDYEKLISPNIDNRECYKKTLESRSWETCPCSVCKTIGIEVIIFSGLNRNKRRGFHNLYVYFNKLKEVRTMGSILVPCIKTQQSLDNSILSFVVDGKDISKFASISRIKRGKDDELLGYQRPELTEHIGDIRSYLEKKDALLPNSIVISFNKKLKFKEDRVVNGHSKIGTLELPIGSEEKAGWIVDGQQRVAALRTLNRDKFPVSVIGIEALDHDREREQFVLVNNTKPLPKSLIYELLPTLGDAIPPKLKKRQRAYRLLECMNFDEESPFYRRIKTVTFGNIEMANIKDLSVLKMIENSMENGILHKYINGGKKPLMILNNFWSAVRSFYGNAWELPPKKSRLTHGVGIISMGYIMDTMAFRFDQEWEVVPQKVFLNELNLVGKDIPWTNGNWRFGDDMVLPWNEVQNTNKHINLVANFIIRKYKFARKQIS